MRGHKTDSGFSLIEALVALAVLSISAGTLLSAVEEHTRAIGAISDRVTALWVAENRLVELSLGFTDLADLTQVDGRDWWIRTTRSDTADPDLVRVDIAVGPASDQTASLARLTGFIDSAGATTW